MKLHKLLLALVCITSTPALINAAGRTRLSQSSIKQWDALFMRAKTLLNQNNPDVTQDELDNAIEQLTSLAGTDKSRNQKTLAVAKALEIQQLLAQGTPEAIAQAKSILKGSVSILAQVTSLDLGSLIAAAEGKKTAVAPAVRIQLAKDTVNATKVRLENERDRMLANSRQHKTDAKKLRDVAATLPASDAKTVVALANKSADLANKEEKTAASLTEDIKKASDSASTIASAAATARTDADIKRAADTASTSLYALLAEEVVLLDEQAGILDLEGAYDADAEDAADTIPAVAAIIAPSPAPSRAPMTQEQTAQAIASFKQMTTDLYHHFIVANDINGLNKYAYILSKVNAGQDEGLRLLFNYVLIPYFETYDKNENDDNSLKAAQDALNRATDVLLYINPPTGMNWEKASDKLKLQDTDVLNELVAIVFGKASNQVVRGAQKYITNLQKTLSSIPAPVPAPSPAPTPVLAPQAQMQANQTIRTLLGQLYKYVQTKSASDNNPSALVVFAKEIEMLIKGNAQPLTNVLKAYFLAYKLGLGSKQLGSEQPETILSNSEQAAYYQLSQDAKTILSAEEEASGMVEMRNFNNFEISDDMISKLVQNLLQDKDYNKAISATVKQYIVLPVPASTFEKTLLGVAGGEVTPLIGRGATKDETTVVQMVINDIYNYMLKQPDGELYARKFLNMVSMANNGTIDSLGALLAQNFFVMAQRSSIDAALNFVFRKVKENSSLATIPVEINDYQKALQNYGQLSASSAQRVVEYIVAHQPEALDMYVKSYVTKVPVAGRITFPKPPTMPIESQKYVASMEALLNDVLEGIKKQKDPNAVKVLAANLDDLSKGTIEPIADVLKVYFTAQPGVGRGGASLAINRLAAVYEKLEQTARKMTSLADVEHYEYERRNLNQFMISDVMLTNLAQNLLQDQTISRAVQKYIDSHATAAQETEQKAQEALLAQLTPQPKPALTPDQQQAADITTFIESIINDIAYQLLLTEVGGGGSQSTMLDNLKNIVINPDVPDMPARSKLFSDYISAFYSNLSKKPAGALLAARTAANNVLSSRARGVLGRVSGTIMNYSKEWPKGFQLTEQQAKTIYDNALTSMIPSLTDAGAQTAISTTMKMFAGSKDPAIEMLRDKNTQVDLFIRLGQIVSAKENQMYLTQGKEFFNSAYLFEVMKKIGKLNPVLSGGIEARPPPSDTLATIKQDLDKFEYSLESLKRIAPYIETQTKRSLSDCIKWTLSAMNMLKDQQPPANNLQIAQKALEIYQNVRQESAAQFGAAGSAAAGFGVENLPAMGLPVSGVEVGGAESFAIPEAAVAPDISIPAPEVSIPIELPAQFI